MTSAELSNPQYEPVFETADEKQDANFAKLLREVSVIYENATSNLGKIVYTDEGGGGDRSKSYSWVHREDNAIARRQGLGYVITRTPKKTDPPVTSDQWRRPDGTYIRGDLILMEMDKDRHRALKTYGELKAIRNLRGANETILAQARQSGIRAEFSEEDGASATKE